MEESCSHPTAEHYMVPFGKRPCKVGTHGPKGQSKSKDLTMILLDKAPLMEENRCVYVLCVGALPGFRNPIYFAYDLVQIIPNLFDRCCKCGVGT